MLKRALKTAISFIVITSFIIWPVFGFSQTGGRMDQEISQLQEQIKSKQQELEKLREEEKGYRKQIKEKQEEQASLKNQISILDSSIAKTEINIRSTQINIDKTNLEIKKVTLEILEKEEDIARKKEYLSSLLRLIYKNEQKNYLEILLLNNSFSEFLDQIKYTEGVSNNLTEVLEKVKQVKQELEEQNEDLEKKKKELEELKKELEEQRADIEDQKVNKKYILDQTKQSEREYQKLLSAAKAEQEQANSEIVSYEREIRKKLAEQQGVELKFSDAGFIWPVAKNVITAYFHDPDYPYRYIFEHPGIDVRAKQGTAIRAAATGYVAKAKDAGYGYSYIMIVHGDGLSTVYSHVSRIDVKADEFVAQGQIIGATGGMPGTRGAGYLTTGPHLHFEVRMNGIPVNPLDYLP